MTPRDFWSGKEFQKRCGGDCGAAFYRSFNNHLGNAVFVFFWVRGSLLSIGVFVKIAYAMGLTAVTLVLKNAYNPSKAATGKFMVDSGAAFTVVPQNMVKKLGLKSTYEKEFSLADGTVIKRQIGSAFIKYKGIETSSPVVLGEKDDSALLGVLTLEALGLVLDPFERKLHPAHLML